jgi:hypothetical protein
MKASATTGTHRARYQERLAGGTAAKLPRGLARAGAISDHAASAAVRFLGGKKFNAQERV